MILISYDIQNDKLRTRFSKYLKKFGYRLQYSVFEITHSKNMLDKINTAIKCDFETQFGQADSVFVFVLGASCKVTRYGHAKNDEEGVIIV